MRTIINRLTVLSLLLLMVGTTQAQQRWWLGGYVNVTNNKSSSDIYTEIGHEPLLKTDNTVTNVNIVPIIGYDLNDKWAVALKVGYNHTKFHIDSKPSSSASQSAEESRGGLTISPMVRWTFAEWQKIRFHVDGLAEYRHMSNKRDGYTIDYNDKANVFSFGFVPGVSYPLTSRLYVTASLGSLLYSTGDDISNPEVSTNKLSLSLWTDLSLGLYVKF